MTGITPPVPAAVRSIDDLLEAMVARGASDLHLSVGTPPAIRVRGELERLDGAPVLTPEDTQQLLYRVLSTERWRSDAPRATIASRRSSIDRTAAGTEGVIPVTSSAIGRVRG